MMNPCAATFKKIGEDQPVWWKNLVSDKEIVIQVRKNDSIDVYFNGGCILKGLKYNSRTQQFAAKIHYKYIPVQSENPYIGLSGDLKQMTLNGYVKPRALDGFDKKHLDFLKNLIRSYYPATSEKGIQYSFYRNDPYFIDTEFQMRTTYEGCANEEDNRIDLIRVDKKLRKIVFVEVKTIGDSRIFNDEIVKQLTRYKNFILANKSDILKYISYVYAAKHQIGSLSQELQSIKDIASYDLCENPLLLFGDCNQKWIDANSPMIDEKIRNIAIGAYYFGAPRYACDIVAKSNRNKHIMAIATV
ncbi:hypothetical protein EOM81_09380 [bacterium]|nr:hypothetical protein [bacterium]